MLTDVLRETEAKIVVSVEAKTEIKKQLVSYMLSFVKEVKQ